MCRQYGIFFYRNEFQLKMNKTIRRTRILYELVYPTKRMNDELYMFDDANIKNMQFFIWKWIRERFPHIKTIIGILIRWVFIWKKKRNIKPNPDSIPKKKNTKHHYTRLNKGVGKSEKENLQISRVTMRLRRNWKFSDVISRPRENFCTRAHTCTSRGRVFRIFQSENWKVEYR